MPCFSLWDVFENTSTANIKLYNKKHSEGQGFLRTSPTEDNLSPSFWTCFSHYHEKVATLRNAFFDITHSGRKKHSSLLGVLLREMKHSGRKKHSSLLGVLFDGDAPSSRKNVPRCKGRFFWS